MKEHQTMITRSFWGALLMLMMVVVLTASVRAAFHYEHDPMKNPKAAEDIIVNEKAVYGYSPNPDSVRLGEFASYDWTDPAVVEKAKKDREDYHSKNEELYRMISDMTASGKSTEEIARAVSKRRNELRLEAYIGNPEGLEKVKKSNLDTYGHEDGPTADELFAKYGSWEKVIEKALSSNPGMDACLGLYDKYYDTYDLAENAGRSGGGVEAGKPASEGNSDPGKADPGNLYEVKTGDCLWKVASEKLGDGGRWKDIYDLNKDQIKMPSRIYAGQKLILPAA